MNSDVETNLNYFVDKINRFHKTQRCKYPNKNLHLSSHLKINSKQIQHHHKNVVVNFGKIQMYVRWFFFWTLWMKS